MLSLSLVEKEELWMVLDKISGKVKKLIVIEIGLVREREIRLGVVVMRFDLSLRLK